MIVLSGSIVLWMPVMPMPAITGVFTAGPEFIRRWKMQGRTHFAAGALLGYCLGGFPGMAVSAVSSLVPDVDCPDSTFGNLIKPVSWAVSTAVGHRTLFHALWIPLFLYFSLPQPYGLWSASGYISHLVLDSLTPEGVRPFWPLPLRVSLPLVPTGSLLENFLLFLVIGAAMIWFVI
jgi:inner membrane protein